MSRSLTKNPFGALPRIPGAFPHCRDGQLSQRDWGGPGDPAVTGSAPRLRPARLLPTAAPRPRPPRSLTARPGTASRPGAARRSSPSRPPAPRPPPRGPASPRSSPRATLRAEAWFPDSWAATPGPAVRPTGAVAALPRASRGPHGASGSVTGARPRDL